MSDYEKELLTTAKVQMDRNRRFFEMAKAILKTPRFVSLLSEAKGDELEGRKARTNATARLIHRIMAAISAPVRGTGNPLRPGLDNQGKARARCLDS